MKTRWGRPVDNREEEKQTRPGELVGAGPNWVTFWSKFGLF